ncbi:MAG: cysteine-rich secretory family protein [Actinomycetia bacterium]|nr:cysteine-rich secretory family protein [Actinomycetes bacterium]
MKRNLPRIAALLVGALAVLSACVPFNSQEEYVFNQTNELRHTEGVAAMSGMDELTVRARKWAQVLADRQSLSHSNIHTIKPKWTAVAENVGRSDTIEHVVTLLERSPDHRHNMENPTYTRSGVGTARGADGWVYVVQLFWAG